MNWFRFVVAGAMLATGRLSAQAGTAPTAGDARRVGTDPLTAPGIAAADLRARLFALAHDSMQGRQAGTPVHDRATAYIAREMERIGLRAAGEGGTFFQTVPLVLRVLDPASRFEVEGRALALWSEVFPIDLRGPTRSTEGATAVFGGIAADSTTWITREQANGKVVVVHSGRGTPTVTALLRGAQARYAGAAALVVTGVDEFLEQRGPDLRAPGPNVAPAPNAPLLPAVVAVPTTVAERLFNSVRGLRPGTAGRTVGVRLVFQQTPTPTRNVIGVLPGSDPALRGQHVVISAHNDHDGVGERALDHDSVRAYNRVMRPQGANDPLGRPTGAERARIRALTDSLRRVRGGVLRDSIFNGADDDGSGTVALLEIAQALAAGPGRPRRSVLFVSHTAEETGLLGSRYFTDHPTVPLDSLVATLNMDMVGRGRAEDIAGGGPQYIQLIGSRRLSTQLGELIDELNARRAEPMRIDYSFDAPGHPLNRYCRSDHFMYARYGIPITYLSRGYHVDYHQVSDHPEYIDYQGMARVAGFVHDIALAVANREARLVVDGPKQDPNAPCRQ